MSTTERRSTKGARVEVREDAGKAPVIHGHAAVFFDPKDDGTRYMLWDDIEERVMPGAFDRAVREKQDVRALWNHNADRVLGRTASGTARLAVDARGLRYEADAPASAADVVESIKRGDVTGSSFGFAVVKDTVTRETRNGRPYYIRQIEDVDLYDVSPVTYPAYSGTDAGARAAIVARATATAEEAAREADAIRAKAGAPTTGEIDGAARSRALDLRARE